MSKLIDYLLEDDTVLVFDVDGVLAPYEFGDLVHSACPDDDWETYVRENDPYAHIDPVPLIQDLIAAKSPERVFACSVAMPYEEAGKRAFVTSNYAIPEDHVVMVASKADKLAELGRLAAAFGVAPLRIALIEDTVKTLDLAYEKGFCTVHVSSLFAYEPYRR